MNNLPLREKVAFITGAGRGIGEGIARVLAERGASVCIADVDHELANATADALRSSGLNAIGMGTDIRDSENLEKAVEKTIGELGDIDICVPNAGVIAANEFETRDHYTTEDWEITREINVLGTVKTIDAIVPRMKTRRSGKIVLISSQGGRAPRGAKLPLGSAIMPYLVSKAASIQLTHQLAIELGPFNINVNAVCPGTVWTPMWERIASNQRETDASLREFSAKEIFKQALQSRHPLAREQTPEDIGRAVAFLASEDAAQITGQALNVNGGAVMS